MSEPLSATFIAAQIISTIALVLVFISFQQKSRQKLLRYQITTSLLSAIQFALLSGYPGSVACLIADFVYGLPLQAAMALPFIGGFAYLFYYRPYRDIIKQADNTFGQYKHRLKKLCQQHPDWGTSPTLSNHRHTTSYERHPKLTGQRGGFYYFYSQTTICRWLI